VQASRWSETQIHFAARALALANPASYEDKSHKGSLQPNQAAKDAACMALSAAARHCSTGTVEPGK
jgi:hypothetical protein